MDVWQNLLHKHIKQINKCWNFYIEVENGGFQKVTTIGGIHFSLLWLWEEGYHRTNSKQTTWKRFWKLRPGPHEVSTIPIWFPADSTKLRSDRFQHLTQLGNLQKGFPPVLCQSPKRMLIVLYQKDVDSSPLNQTILIWKVVRKVKRAGLNVCRTPCNDDSQQ